MLVEAPLAVTVANVSVSLYEVKYLPSKSTLAPALPTPDNVSIPLPVLNDAEFI